LQQGHAYQKPGSKAQEQFVLVLIGVRLLMIKQILLFFIGKNNVEKLEIKVRNIID
jgi:hypothetical protein